MIRHLFAYFSGSTFASIVFAIVSMLAGQWQVAFWLLVLAVLSLSGVLVVRTIELRATLLRELRP